MESSESFRKKVCNANGIPAIWMAVEDTVKNHEGVLLENPSLCLKKVLISYLKNGKVNRLDVICSHVPKCFNTELEVLGFISKIVSELPNKLTIRIVNRQTL
ncbi:hypothetical protein FXW07_07290 [Methanosarcina sp. DH1]|uniref:Fe-only nitrogenase accessory AnfO family protein n=1 Tax=Methanosarcina sp. DH1 TaxID=2605695 RepID=UPI001E3F5845|nr:Fe-only nitrogenase accessory AnfO family protein [Methanosarcina sp. DH1]MCC4766424.1 hypothetical protein [Methanosarcina sp. DH1]